MLPPEDGRIRTVKDRRSLEDSYEQEQTQAEAQAQLDSQVERAAADAATLLNQPKAG
jgi:hypothetical protein